MGKKLPPLPPLPPKLVLRPRTVDFQSGGEVAGVSISASGIQSLIDTLKDLPFTAMDACGAEMATILLEVVETSRDKYVPYRDGYLRDSAGSDSWDGYTMNAGNIVEMRCWFGAPASAAQIRQGVRAGHSEGVKFIDPSIYALDQHENLSYHHPIIGPVSMPKAKYLETPFNEMQPKIMPRLGNAINAAWGGSIVANPVGSDVANGPTDTSDLDDILGRINAAPNYPGYGSR